MFETQVTVVGNGIIQPLDDPHPYPFGVGAAAPAGVAEKGTGTSIWVRSSSRMS
jgi:hypothetical protein